MILNILCLFQLQSDKDNNEMVTIKKMKLKQPLYLRISSAFYATALSLMYFFYLCTCSGSIHRERCLPVSRKLAAARPIYLLVLQNPMLRLVGRAPRHKLKLVVFLKWYGVPHIRLFRIRSAHLTGYFMLHV